MQCRNCREELPGGVAFCPNCGAPATTPFISSPNQPVAPTMLASSPNQGVPPTVVAPMPGQPVPPEPANLYAPPPPTNYGESAPPPPINPYSASPSSPYNPTGPYSAPAQAPYGTPPAPYGAPGTYTPPPQFAPMQQPPKKKANGCVIALVIVLVLLLLIGGGVVALVNYAAHRVTNAVTNADATVNAIASAVPTFDNSLSPTATTGTNTGNAPTTGQIDPTAATFITAAQTSSNVDSNGNPTDSKSSFNVGDTAYISFTSSGHAGYSLMKLYRDGNFDIQANPLSLDASSPGGYFSVTINNPGQFVAGVYWCTKSDCSDAALAQVVSFSAA